MSTRRPTGRVYDHDRYSSPEGMIQQQRAKIHLESVERYGLRIPLQGAAYWKINQ